MNWQDRLESFLHMASELQSCRLVRGTVEAGRQIRQSQGGPMGRCALRAECQCKNTRFSGLSGVHRQPHRGAFASKLMAKGHQFPGV